MVATEIITIVATVVAVGSAAASTAVYLTKVRIEGNKKIKDNSEAMATMASTIESLRGIIETLTRQLEIIKKAKDGAAHALAEIDKTLGEVRQISGATSDAILVPNPYSMEDLIFLTANGDAAEKIKKMKVPIQGSLAGSVFKVGKISNVHDPDDTVTRHYRATDMKAGFRSVDILSIPLVDAGKTVGVLQLLNKKSGDQFDSDDLMRVELFTAALGSAVAKLTSDPETLRLLGIVERIEEQVGTIMFANIIGFSSLTRRMAMSDLVIFMNEYFDRVGTIALQHGCTIEKYLGGGLLLRFNVPLVVDNYAKRAVMAALAIQTEFKEIRREWSRIGFPVAEIDHRIGVATGPVAGAQLGHPHHLTHAVLGPTVSVASELCDIARRTSNKIVICKTTYEMISEYLSDMEVVKVDARKGSIAWAVAAGAK